MVKSVSLFNAEGPVESVCCEGQPYKLNEKIVLQIISKKGAYLKVMDYGQVHLNYLLLLNGDINGDFPIVDGRENCLGVASICTPTMHPSFRVEAEIDSKTYRREVQNNSK